MFLNKTKFLLTIGYFCKLYFTSFSFGIVNSFLCVIVTVILFIYWWIHFYSTLTRIRERLSPCGVVCVDDENNLRVGKMTVYSKLLADMIEKQTTRT